MPARRRPPVANASQGSDWRPLEREFGIALAVILLGYMFLGKGFAYLHIPVGFPFYVGEIVLSLGLLAAALRPRMLFRRAFHTLPVKLYVLFFVDVLGEYGIDSMRDAALYYYGLFMILVFELVLGKGRLERAIRAYGRAAAVFIIWIPVALLLFYFTRPLLPLVPGTDVPLLVYKGGDMLVHAAGAMTFALLVKTTLDKSREWSILLYFSPALAAMLLVNRGGLVSFACALGVAFVLGRGRSLWRPLLAVTSVALLLLIIDPRVKVRRNKEISIEATVESVRSIFVDAGYREGTKQWRLSWWSQIVDETFSGRYFWKGKGFGTNLADVHGFQVVREGSKLRSPHNVHMTVLARMGVPGFLLWVLLQGALAWRFYSSWRRARDAGNEYLRGILAWVLCYWVAFIVNSSFDVYLEGPQGAIWFWSVMGLGLATSHMDPGPPGQERVEGVTRLAAAWKGR